MHFTVFSEYPNKLNSGKEVEVKSSWPL